ncbi:MAG: hypothetical protein HC798_03750 [Polaribacter sp.]|nr:hypothetical protein [Polaribacter sp.]
MKPRYPVYIISKGRYDKCLTANFMVKDGVDFKLVVEPQEADEYKKLYGDRVLVLPFSNLGQGSIPARNWVWEHSIKQGAERHWIFDDNIRSIKTVFKGKRIICDSNKGIAICEDFIDRYSNVGIGGMNYSMFVVK